MIQRTVFPAYSMRSCAKIRPAVDLFQPRRGELVRGCLPGELRRNARDVHSDDWNLVSTREPLLSMDRSPESHPPAAERSRHAVDASADDAITTMIALSRLGKCTRGSAAQTDVTASSRRAQGLAAVRRRGVRSGDVNHRLQGPRPRTLPSAAARGAAWARPSLRRDAFAPHDTSRQPNTHSLSHERSVIHGIRGSSQLIFLRLTAGFILCLRKNRGKSIRSNTIDLIGRGDWIRTSDPLLPKQMRYQAALRPDSKTPDFTAFSNG